MSGYLAESSDDQGWRGYPFFNEDREMKIVSGTNLGGGGTLEVLGQFFVEG